MTLRLLAQIYGTTWDRLIDLHDLDQMPPEDRDAYHGVLAARHRNATSLAAKRVLVPEREPAYEESSRESLLEQAAEESADLAAWAGTSNVDEEMLAELNRRLRSLAHAYVCGQPFPLLVRTRQLRNRVSRLLQGRQNWQHTRDLYLLNARSCTLLAWMTGDLGNYLAAGDHASAAWLCAQLADHDGARTWVRATQSKLAYWSGDFVESARLAADGLTYRSSDSSQVLLALLQARTNARLGRVAEAETALGLWRDAREQVPGPDEVGGVLGLTQAQQHYLAGSTHLELRQPAEALAETTRALELFEGTPVEERFYGAEVLARIDGVQAHLQGGELDGAADAMEPVFTVDPDQRLDTFVQSMKQVRLRLAHPQYRGSPATQKLQERIEEYAVTAIGRSLELPR
ncbi:hypothetical protein DPM19_23345 [Actinomadura craniellae]|uniref:XRE family transcriptional regulator n=2 Tax=Actinomadura craniellae TaxID=2231787 RepID=A0A365H1H2_9ACTN|nr:hypothetical protein DPM19_23345 [Actinomadura craniellae]